MKVVKKIVSLLLTVSMLITFGSTAFAKISSDISRAAAVDAGGNAGAGAGGNTGMPDPSISGTNPFSNMGNTVLGFIQWFGYVVAVGMLIYIGIKYMMSSANDKADLKKGSVNYVIGAVLVAAAATVAGAFQTIGGNL